MQGVVLRSDWQAEFDLSKTLLKSLLLVCWWVVDPMETVDLSCLVDPLEKSLRWKEDSDTWILLIVG